MLVVTQVIHNGEVSYSYQWLFFMWNMLGLKCFYLLDQCFLSKPVLYILVPRDILENKTKQKFCGQIDPAYYISHLEMFQAHYYMKGSEKSYNKETCVPLTNLVFLAFDQGNSPFLFSM